MALSTTNFYIFLNFTRILVLPWLYYQLESDKMNEIKVR